jgi:hypothetical protein
MTLPGSGTLDYNSIRAEFGSPSSNVYLNLYYRGGPYTYAVPANSNITTSSSGQLSVSNFYGAKNKTDYFQFGGGTYDSGGKSPITYYGVGGPSLPSAGPDASGLIGSGTYTFSKYYSGGNFFSAQSPTGYHDTNWVARYSYIYNSSGSLVATWNTSGTPAPVRAYPDTGTLGYNLLLDSLGNIGQPAPTPVFAAADWPDLGGYFVVKAF